jgi:hypothetical protein
MLAERASAAAPTRIAAIINTQFMQVKIASIPIKCSYHSIVYFPALTLNEAYQEETQ